MLLFFSLLLWFAVVRSFLPSPIVSMHRHTLHSVKRTWVISESFLRRKSIKWDEPKEREKSQAHITSSCYNMEVPQTHNKQNERIFFAICPKDCPQATRRHKYWHLYIWYGMYGPIHCIQTLADQFILVIFFGVSLSKTICPVYDSDGLFCSISLDRFILLVSQASNI